MKKENRNVRGVALLPFLLFIGIYLGAGLVIQRQGGEMAFYQFPPVTAMFIAVMVAFFMTRGSIEERFAVFAAGIGKKDVITMLVIYLLAGAFSAVAAEMGGRDATVNMGLSFVRADHLAAGIFLISAFMGTATGSSMGTVSAVVPIAAGIAEKSGLDLPLVVGACVGGAMFGDNLSMISDTTIAATRSQGCGMKDKFRMNFLVALPAAVVTLFLLLVTGKPATQVALGDLSYRVIKVLPYLTVLILALLGVSVFAVLTIGIALSGLIGMGLGDLTVLTFARAVWTGFTSMNEVFFLTFLCAGMSEMIRHNGGITWLLKAFDRKIKGQRSAQGGIALLVALVDCATANNTVAIILTGDLARDISRTYKVDPRKTASLLDIFSCVVQGIMPYGAQLLTAAALVNLSVSEKTCSATDLMFSVKYCFLLALFALLAIVIPYADGTIRRNPWDYEAGRPKSQK